jgi:hypothetical protein
MIKRMATKSILYNVGVQLPICEVMLNLGTGNGKWQLEHQMQMPSLAAS